VIQSKICMLGGFGVGKTSLVSRFVHSIFSDKYLTTVGVKIEKKSVAAASQQVDLIIWDIYGEDDFQKVRASYLRGSSGYLLVADGTRRETLATARALHDLAHSVIGHVPFVLVLNKTDLVQHWEMPESDLVELASGGWQIVRTSAKTGTNVDAAFDVLASKMLAAR
jgi:small GTP-binding protein